MRNLLIVLAAGASLTATSMHAQPSPEADMTPVTAPRCCTPIDCATVDWRWEEIRDSELSIRDLELRISEFPELPQHIRDTVEANKKILETHREYVGMIENYCEGLLLVR